MQWQIGMALSTMDQFLKPHLPLQIFEQDSDLDYRCILKLTNGTPLAVISVDIDSIEIKEAEMWQRNGRDDGRISFIA